MNIKITRFWFLLLITNVMQGQIPSKDPIALLKSFRSNKTDSVKIALSIKISEFYLFKPDNAFYDIDNAKAYADTAIRLSRGLNLNKQEIKGLLLKGDCFMEANEVALGSPYFLQAVKISRSLNDKLLEATIWERFSDCIAGNISYQNLRLENYRIALRIYKSLNKVFEATNVQKNIADMLFKEGKLDEAEKNFLGVVNQYKNFKYAGLESIYNTLVSLSLIKGDLNKQLYYAIEAVKVVESNPDLSSRSYYYLILAKTYTKIGSYDNAEHYFQKALQDHEVYKNFIFYPLIHHRNINLLFQHRKDFALYLIKKAFKEHPPKTSIDSIYAEYSLATDFNAVDNLKASNEEFIKLSKLSKSAFESHKIRTSDYQSCLSPYITLLIRLKKINKAKELIQIINSLPKNERLNTINKDLEFNQYIIYSGTHQYRQALLHFKNFVQIRDSIYNVAKNRERIEMQFNFETAKKDHDIQIQKKNILLLKQQSQLQISNAQRLRLLRNMIFICLLVSVIILGILYNRYNSKIKTNKLLNLTQIEISSKNAALERLLKENELLLREVHHRVKNNLQIIISLLVSQSVYLKDDRSLKAIVETQHRIQAMALLHQKLYNGTQFSTIYMPEYISDMVEYLKDSFKLKQKILFELKVDPIVLDINYAVPLGLIINEVITNAIKHAFPKSNNDRITLNLFEINDLVQLTIADNGQGLPDNFQPQDDTFGMTLIKGLTEDLCGTFDIFDNHGTTIKILFPLTILI